MTHSLIKDEELLRETSQIPDLFDLSQNIKCVESLIENITKSSTLGFIGKFGIGKSTLLHQIQKADDQYLWVNFDAWKYPNKEDLWEGLILDFAEQLGERKKIKNKIDATGKKKKALDIVGIISMGLSGLSIFDKFVELFKSSPATRTYEMQNIFKGLIESQEKDIIFILEDIDRSGDGGIYFLETLRQFIHSLDSKKLIIAIVPIGSINYEKNNSSYLKCLDYVERLSISHNSFEKFVNEIFKDELFVENILDESKRIIFTASKMKTQTASFLRALYKSEYNINIRLMKQIIRKADKTYLAQIKDGHKPDWRVTLCIEATKNSFAKKGDQFFERIKNSNSILESSIFAKFISTMIEDRESMYSSNDDLIQYRKDIIIVHQNGISFPEYPYRCEIDFEKNGYAINSFYLEY